MRAAPHVRMIRRGIHVMAAILVLVASKSARAQTAATPSALAPVPTVAPAANYPDALVGTWRDVTGGRKEWGVRLVKGGYGSLTCRCVPAHSIDFKWTATTKDLVLLTQSTGTPFVALPYSVSKDGILQLPIPSDLTRGNVTAGLLRATLSRTSEEVLQGLFEDHRRLAIRAGAVMGCCQ